jgi:hypothetical protein
MAFKGGQAVVLLKSDAAIGIRALLTSPQQKAKSNESAAIVLLSD